MPSFDVIMSRTLHKHFPAIKLCAAEEYKLNMRKKMIDACCDANFTKAVTKCCGMSRTVELHYQVIKYNNLNDTRHCYEKNAIQSGSGFTSLLPLLLGPIVAGTYRLIKGK